ncbi:hypothetical protein ACH489_19685 [Streptomyces rubiginosohelvolus]|uniref:hypothetical protein n=1 Tax=Streptomyces rubiginosohelvolus TaxID=67362 RepID=UPI003789FC2C
MPDATALEQATTMIEEAWGRPIEALESLAVRRPTDDPLLRSAMNIRSALLVTADSTVAVHQERLHALTRPGHAPAFYDLQRITSSAADLRVAQAESRTALQAISHVIQAREAAATADGAPAVRLAQAAVARSGRDQHVRGHLPDQVAPPAAAGPPAPGPGPRR